MNPANGPVTATLLTLLVGLPILISFSDNQPEKHEYELPRYADHSKAFTTLTSGIASASA